MKWNLLKSMAPALGMVLAFFFLPGSIAVADGKQVFLDMKCNKCHTIKSAAITQLPKAPAEPGEEEDEEEAPKEPTDLSKLDDQVMKAPEGAKEHVKKWLKKEVQHTTKEGKLVKHKKLFKGSDADLQALVDFLVK